MKSMEPEILITEKSNILQKMCAESLKLHFMFCLLGLFSHYLLKLGLSKLTVTVKNSKEES